jgi:hypothetical protein
MDRFVIRSPKQLSQHPPYGARSSWWSHQRRTPGAEAKVRMRMQCPFASPKRLEGALQNARIAELERHKALEKSASRAVVSSKRSLRPIVVVRNQLEWGHFCASARI